MVHGRHVLDVPPFFVSSACRVTISSNIRVTNQTKERKNQNDQHRLHQDQHLRRPLIEAKDEGGSWESIDRDQAVDDEGHAYYTVYAFTSADEAYRDPAKTFTAEQVEQFAKTW